MKLAREIKAAAKVGGPNPDANPRLKAAIDKALQNNLSHESIQRNISGSQGKDADLVKLEYECYGPNGLQIIISALTDNSNRVASNLRGYLSKLNGEIAKTNSVKMFFNTYGDIIVAKNNKIDMDQILEATMANDIVDIIELEDAYEIYCTPEDFYNVKKALADNHIDIFDSDVKLIAQNKVEINDEEIIKKIERFIDQCENDDDIQ